MVQFSNKDAQRIARATKHYENSVHNKATGAKKHPVVSPTGFWAVITDRDEQGYYSWRALEPTAGDILDENTDWGQGSKSADSGYAVEVYDFWYVPKYTRVWMTPARTNDYYVFLFTGGTYKGELDDDIDSDDYGSVTLTLWDGEYEIDDQIDEVWNDFSHKIKYDDGAIVEVAYQPGGYWKIVSQDCEDEEDPNCPYDEE